MINPNYRVDIVGDLEHEDLTADIYFQDQIVATLLQEKGFENLEIDIYPSKLHKIWHFNYSEFEQVLQHAKKRLWELRKIEE